MRMKRNPIGVISMSYARPFGPEHFFLFPRMRASGMDFCELLVPEPDEFDPEAARTVANAAGLFLLFAVRVNASRDLSSPDPAVHAAAIAYLCAAVDVASAAGARIVGGPLYGSPLVFAGRAPMPIGEPERAARIARVTEGLRVAGAYAAERGVTLAIEPLNRFETDFCNLAAQAAELARAVASAAVGVMLDTFHMNMEEDDLPAAIRAVGSALVHFQANENHRGFLGTGHIDWAAIARALAAIGYAGPITLEPFRRRDRRLSAPLAQWRPPEVDEDADLAASAAFLRGVLHAAAVA
ncbi:MAG: sugar phosphate isomerase/epimerase [Rhodospirillales bacterium]|nr:sugar phosphate isomerase/epimerase [Rhodospirillales bacterium]